MRNWDGFTDPFGIGVDDFTERILSTDGVEEAILPGSTETRTFFKTSGYYLEAN